jgi:hypothetical protein
MSNRELDRIFRERLGNFEMEPPMHLWDNIAAARANARRPLRPWVWWSGGVGLFALAAGVALWFSMSPAPESELPAPAGKVPVVTLAADLPPAAPPPQGSGVSLGPEEKAAAAPLIAAKQAVAEESGQETIALTVLERPEPAPASLQTPELIVHKTSFEALPAAALPQLRRNLRLRDGFPENSCRPFSKETWKLHLYAEAIASPEYVFRSLSPRSKDFAAYGESRQSMEEVRGGFSAGLRMSAVTNFGLSLRSGLQYTQINEVLNYRDPEDIRVIVTNIYDGQGNIIGSDTIFEQGTRIRVAYNRYRMLDVPVMAGYEFQFPRFSMTVHGGALFNVLFLKKGDILGPEGNPVGISSSEEDPYPAFKDRLGISLGGSVGFNYRLTPELQFVVEPQFRVVLDPVTRSDYPLKQDYFLTGISLGVRQKL